MTSVRPQEEIFPAASAAKKLQDAAAGSFLEQPVGCSKLQDCSLNTNFRTAHARFSPCLLGGVAAGSRRTASKQSLRLTVLGTASAAARYQVFSGRTTTASPVSRSAPAMPSSTVLALCLLAVIASVLCAPRGRHVSLQIATDSAGVPSLFLPGTSQPAVVLAASPPPVELPGADWSLGNHEFDDGVAGLVPFLENASFPVVAANLDTSLEPALAASPLRKSVVLHLPGGPDVGVIGYLTPETKLISFTEKVKFLDEVESIKQEAERLKSEGINILIALGHSGYKTDQKIASEVPDIDVVIGGHTNTFLYTGDAPDTEVPVDLYPKIITQPSGKKVPVVQAYAYTKYMGNLTVVFDENGELKSFAGNPILLNSSVEEDSEVLEALEEWRAEVENSTKEVIGKTRVLLDGTPEHCRLFECNLGNLVTDAMVYTNAKSYHGNGWTNAPIALFNGGGIRSSIDTSSDGNVTKEDILATLPFQNTLYFEKINGSQLLSALENGVYHYEEVTTKGIGGFPQLSGLKVTYNISKPPGARVQEVLVLCGECRVPTYSSLKENDVYGVIIPAFMKRGGDNYTVFENSIESSSLDYIDSDIVADYIKQKSPVYPAIEERILFESAANQENDESDSSSDAIQNRSTKLLHYVLATISIYFSLLM